MYDRQFTSKATSVLGLGTLHGHIASAANVCAAQQCESQLTTERPELAAALSHLDNAVGGLEQTLGELAGRLNPVLRPESVGGGESGNAPTPVRCSVSLEIEGIEDRVRALAGVVANLLHRLAV